MALRKVLGYIATSFLLWVPIVVGTSLGYLATERIDGYSYPIRRDNGQITVSRSSGDISVAVMRDLDGDGRLDEKLKIIIAQKAGGMISIERDITAADQAEYRLLFEKL